MDILIHFKDGFEIEIRDVVDRKVNSEIYKVVTQCGCVQEFVTEKIEYVKTLKE